MSVYKGFLNDEQKTAYMFDLRNIEDKLAITQRECDQAEKSWQDCSFHLQQVWGEFKELKKKFETTMIDIEPSAN